MASQLENMAAKNIQSDEERQAQQSKEIKDKQKAKTKAFHDEVAALGAGDVVVKESDVLLVNRDGVDYKVSFDEVVDSLPLCGPFITKEDVTGDFEYFGYIDPATLDTFVDNWPSTSTGQKFKEGSQHPSESWQEAHLYKIDCDYETEVFQKFQYSFDYVSYIDADGNEQEDQIKEWYRFEDYDNGRQEYLLIEVYGIPKEAITLTNKTKLSNACVPSIEQVIRSGDTSGMGVHLDGSESTFLGAGIRANIIRCESVSYFDDRMYAKNGMQLGNNIYFANKYDDWYTSDQGQISNISALRFGNYKDEGKATDINGVENIYFKSGDEFANDWSGMISGMNALHFSRNGETDNSTQLTGLTKLRFTENDDTGDNAEVTGLTKLRFSENDTTGDTAEVTGLTKLFMDEGEIYSVSRLMANSGLDSNIVAQLPELPDSGYRAMRREDIDLREMEEMDAALKEK